MPEERDIDLVLLTGAGASCAFGSSRTGGPSTLPLMAEWSNILLQALGSGRHNLRELVGLTENLDGPEFERRLGDFLALVRFFPSIQRILAPSIIQTAQQRIRVEDLKNWGMTLTSRMEDAVGVIYQSMIEQFGWERIDADAALWAYKALFDSLELTPNASLVYATTNYDSIGESILDRLGWNHDSGVRYRFAGPGVRSGERIDPANLLQVVGRSAPVFHLHGAVGWVDNPSEGPIPANATSYNAALGVPIVMLPSLDKDYQQSRTIQTIWLEFRKSLRRAKRVLVLGHSLNDPALVEALAQDVQPQQRIAVTFLPECPPPGPWITTNPPLADYQPFPVRFAADFSGEGVDREQWDQLLEAVGISSGS